MGKCMCCGYVGVGVVGCRLGCGGLGISYSGYGLEGRKGKF